jgi:hypothetical protein
MSATTSTSASATTRTTSSSQAPVAAEITRLGRLRRSARTAAAALLVAAAAMTSLVVATGTASASYSTTTVDAACGHREVRAESPNLTGFVGWAIVWSPTLYRYTTAGWQRYLVGATLTQSAQSWDIGQVTFGNLPSGWYYQVRATYQWVYNGRYNGPLHVNEPVAHHLNGLAVNMTWNEQMYSTSSYCYVG